MKNPLKLPSGLNVQYRTVKMQFVALSRNTPRRIVLGSSHAWHGYYAEEGELNLGATSVDLYIADKCMNMCAGNS